MEIRQSRFGDYLVLHAAGRIDTQTSETFQTELLAAIADSGTDLIIDFAQVEYISSAGFRALMTAARQVPREHRIAVVALNELVRELFAIARFHHVISVFASAEEAVAEWLQSRQAAPPDAGPIRVHFWGTRGSLPAPLGDKAQYQQY